MKDLDEASRILGIQIYRDRSKSLIGLSQSVYIDKVLKRFNMLNSKKEMIPMVLGKPLSKAGCPTTSQARDYIGRIPYASVIGSIMYAMLCTRPDVVFPLNMTSRFQSDLGESHWTVIKNVFKYLYHSKLSKLVISEHI